MFGIFDRITEYFKEILLEIINSNFEGMFIDINDKVTLVAGEVSKSQSSFNGAVFEFVKNINDKVIIPIAGLIITAVLCLELINIVMRKNNMHEVDTFEFFKYVIKMWGAVFLVTHAFDFLWRLLI